MIKRTIKGQEATEFVLISILVFFSALIVITMFGGKISSFFKSDSSASKVSLLKAKTISAADQQRYNSNIDPVNVPKNPNQSATPVTAAQGDLPPGTATASGNSYTVDINGESVSIPVSAVDALNKAMETSGSSGTLQKIVDDVKYMSTKFNAPPSDIEIMLGSSTQDIDVVRKGKAKTIGLSGKADINMICYKYNDQILIRNKSLQVGDNVSEKFTSTLQLKIEGAIASDNKFTATTLESSNDAKFATQKGQTAAYNTTVTKTTDGGLIFNAGKYDLKNKAFTITSDTGADNVFKSTGTLSLSFTNPNYKFSLK